MSRSVSTIKYNLPFHSPSNFQAIKDELESSVDESSAQTITGDKTYSGDTIFYVTSASTSGSTSVEPIVMTSEMTGAGGVGGRAKFRLDTNVALGGWANALKAHVVFGASGSVSGLGSALVAELQLSAGTDAGTYAPLESEVVVGSGGSTGTASSFLYCNVDDDNATFNTNGFLFELGSGVADTASGLFDANAKAGIGMTHTLRVRVGGTTYYLPLHTSANFGGS